MEARKKIKICVVVGTRPEAIKMAPVILALKKEDWCDVHILATAQHREMMDQVFALFKLEADRDLDIMVVNQTLAELTSRLIVSMDQAIDEIKPDIILAQGDTTTVMCAALAAFYKKIPFGHVEAGLRTGDMSNPFPEEMNRVVVSRLAQYHFAPTEKSKKNLLAEGIAEHIIYVTGNTVIDALLSVSTKDIDTGFRLTPGKRLILVTAHRRENFGQPFHEICTALRQIVTEFDDVEIIFPVHPNPNIKEVAYRELSDHPSVHLCPPLDYGPFVTIMKQAYLILTDSGGVQEEAPALGKPVLVLRSDTERPEAVKKNVVKVIGTRKEDIFSEVKALLTNRELYNKMAVGSSPYGDGKAAGRIVSVLHDALCL
jgi:UDP-N-acetylglucosamine 2-epimerase (non-hydrolysing)